MKLFAALHDDTHQGWVWLQDSRLPARSIVRITNPSNKKSVYCEALQIDDNFLIAYNQSPRVSITEPQSSLVIGSWYRAALGGLSTQQEVPLTVRPCNSLWGRFLACVHHPQAVVRVAAGLGLISLLLGFFGIVLGVLSLLLSNPNIGVVRAALQAVRPSPHVIKGKDGAALVSVPAGEFWMGSEDGGPEEKPRRRVYLDAFSIDKYEVTNVLYRRFMDATGHRAPTFWTDSSANEPNQPVVGVSWHDASAYCQRAGKRLPTEAEWEKAARGTDGRKYPWGDQWDSSRANSAESRLGKPAEVGSYASGMSPYGADDMAGNVWEWVVDWYDPNYYQTAPNRNPKGPDSPLVTRPVWAQDRVTRGGSWVYSEYDLRVSVRSGWLPTNTNMSIGFRCAQ